MITRRTLLIIAALSATTTPGRGVAQPAGTLRRVGFLSSIAAGTVDPESQRWLDTLARGLEKLGWVEGRNLQMEFRRAAATGVVTRELAEDLVRAQPEIVIASSTAGLRVLQQATRTIPIVFIGVSDPVRDGYVESLARPGGNATGFSTTEPGMSGKWCELLRAVAPQVNEAVILFNPDTAPHTLYMEPLRSVATTFGLTVVPGPVRSPAEIDSVLAKAGDGGRSGMIVLPDSFMFVHRKQIADRAAQHRIPAIHPLRGHAISGGLISYGVDFADLYARAATYVDRILKGEKPGELPVQGPVKFETVINLKAAKALGIDVPDALVAQAEEIIE